MAGIRVWDMGVFYTDTPLNHIHSMFMFSLRKDLHFTAESYCLSLSYTFRLFELDQIDTCDKLRVAHAE
jgi:hypothetical protein